MADPKAAFTDNPYAECLVELTFTGQGRASMFGGEPDEPHETPGEEFAKGHYEQLVEGRGVIRVGDEEWEVAGCGLRDHSWGPRYWQAPVVLPLADRQRRTATSASWPAGSPSRTDRARAAASCGTTASSTSATTSS